MFHLTKHYFDAIDTAGNTAILYAGTLRIFFIKIPFSSCILCNANADVHETGVLKKAETTLNGRISFAQKRINIDASWEPIDMPISEKLHTLSNKNLVWHCHTPKAIAHININEKKIEGLGYCETIQLPFFPWKLNIDQLKWGRFLSEKNTIIWIEWVGRTALKKIYRNGQVCTDVEIGENGLTFRNENLRLIFGKKQTIRNNPLASIAERHPILKLIFRKSFLQSREVKYKSASTLVENDEIIDEGWSLFEIVNWKQ